MDGQGILEKARRNFRKKRFSTVIALLEPNVINYRDSFPCFYMLGVSCMYMGDMGGAVSYLQRARQIKMRDPNLLAAQAALHLRRGDTNEAVEYYLEALEYDPHLKTAKRALAFIRKRGDPDTISGWIDNGKIKRFYPETGRKNPAPAIITGVCALLIAGTAFLFLNKNTIPAAHTRADLSTFVLSGTEKSSPVDLSGGAWRYILTEKQIMAAYSDMQKYFNKERDNAAQVEINRILYSNASSSIRQKARLFMDYLSEPDFNTIKDNYTWAQVSAEPWLYVDCWVVWSGRAANIVSFPSSLECDLSIGYADLKILEGIVPVRFDYIPSINPQKPLKILGKIGLRDGERIYLKGRAVYQPVQPGSPF